MRTQWQVSFDYRIWGEAINKRESQMLDDKINEGNIYTD